jgi:hypothetical protein
VVDLVRHTVQLLDSVFAVSHCPCVSSRLAVGCEYRMG